jgi:hypothetical protein
MPCRAFGSMGGGSREAQMPQTQSHQVRKVNSRLGRLGREAVFVSTVAQLGGRDYSLVGAANQEEIGKIRYVGRLREWAVVAAVILAVFAALSWTDPFYFLIFLIPAVAFALLALMVHFTRPVIEVEERETKTGNSRRRETKYPPP